MNEKTKYFRDLAEATDKSDYRTLTRLLYFQVLHVMCDLLKTKGRRVKGRVNHVDVRWWFIKLFNLSEEIRDEIDEWKEARENVDYKREEQKYYSEERLKKYIVAMRKFIEQHQINLFKKSEI